MRGSSRMSSRLLEEGYRYYSLKENEKKAVLDRVRKVLEKRSVGLAILFGSFLEGEAFRDVDVAVYSENLDFDELLRLGVELELELGMPVDLAPLDQLSPKFRLEVLRRGLIVVERPGVYENLYMRSQDELISMTTSASQRNGQRVGESFEAEPTSSARNEGKQG